MKTLLDSRSQRRTPRAARGRGKASTTLTILASALFGVLVAAMAPGCGSGTGDICAQAKQCEGGNDADEQACNIVSDEQSDIADLHGCSSEFDSYVDCLVDNSRCNNHRYKPDEGDCDRVESQWQKCVGN